MGVSPKKRRQILINDRAFYWQVRQDEDYLEEGWPIILSVVSDDKQFNIIYGIAQTEEDCHLISLGNELPRFPHGQSGKKAGKNINHYRHVPCPKWSQTGSVTPEVVRELVEWCFASIESN
jgi:hypothetical protein